MMNTAIEDGEIRAKIQTTLSESDIDLFGDGEIASLDLMLAALRLEKEFSIKFEIDEIVPKNFGSVEVIAKMIKSKLQRPKLTK